MKAHDFDKVVKKFGMESRDGRDLWAWFWHEGKVILRTRRSKGTGKDLPERLIRKQLHLTQEQLRLAVRCTLKRTDYLRILDEQGLL